MDSLLRYLDLPQTYEPSPSSAPIAFLAKHAQILPKNFLLQFSETTSPKERTVIPTIRNRRFKFSQSNPRELSFDSAKNTWPTLWTGPVERRGQAEGQDERTWAEKEFMGGPGILKQHVGKLGILLGDYEEEREAERSRAERRAQTAAEPFIPEEDEESDDDEPNIMQVVEESPEQARVSFERLIKERFIYGLLESDLYDIVDWDDRWDVESDKDIEDRWFDDEEESTADQLIDEP